MTTPTLNEAPEAMHAEAKAWLAEEASASAKSQKKLEALQPQEPAQQQSAASEEVPDLVLTPAEAVGVGLGTIEIILVKFKGQGAAFTELETKQLTRLWLPMARHYLPENGGLPMEAAAIFGTAAILIPKLMMKKSAADNQLIQSGEAQGHSQTQTQARAA